MNITSADSYKMQFPVSLSGNILSFCKSIPVSSHLFWFSHYLSEVISVLLQTLVTYINQLSAAWIIALLSMERLETSKLILLNSLI